MREKPVRVLFTGGGSGGPTLPLLALAEEIGKQKIGSEFLFLGSKKGPERKMVEQTEIPFVPIPSGKLRRYWSLRNLFDPLFILGGGLVGLLHLLTFRPQVIVSAGSFVSVPVAYAAWCLRIPHVILQMDLRPGLANRLMAPVSQALVSYFKRTANQFPSISLKRKIGPVVRNEIFTANAENANERFGLHQERPLILITGGGQGAVGLNRAVLPLLKHLLMDFQVVHLTGSGFGKKLNSESPIFSHPDYHPLEVVHEGMGDLLAKSEIVLTRAGMGIIGELAVLQKDTVLIPLPGTHQEDNAKIIQENNAAEFVSQEVLATMGIKWWNNFLELRVPGEMGKRLHKLLPDGGTKDFAQLIFEITDKG
ncbi:MAG TPA: UDP-N-acetylglucosamine--N-acetylmuramyl-(pentapeptide) pyrophosphoryl-undecaprenol N-acetylglucosamine transferase [Deltaproteobacteria bacterium]|nr:UDP-N-acetylglucosamine--N-acetylmuramyl-(pentapeptide) pyrophosphoryl-undecaprenol N-acetylglucosamine transferase [Deltaproteobacteria bacterium]HIA56601.1 UDP-N-acetylglucosamine--N-acetylmuramyl-(pentapeptide) pyrophosphoryl-undecaprenol N-acetylglucosamine transferase [Candidatus Lambdaproteobacteria bacterium]HIB93364.1 UDP-N-acetylglucosamine--N-acetylmuramyl-(pentapeptide) pyrophosphoryl-undecaprenol N-acetylglucosamine transferase [Candidatus Lambdaproteobacteria bacterium]HIN47912.1